MSYKKGVIFIEMVQRKINYFNLAITLPFLLFFNSINR